MQDANVLTTLIENAQVRQSEAASRVAIASRQYVDYLRSHRTSGRIREYQLKASLAAADHSYVLHRKVVEDLQATLSLMISLENPTK